MIFVETSIPSEPGWLFECSATGRGAFIGVVHKGASLQFRFTAGDGGFVSDVSNVSDENTAVITVALPDPRRPQDGRKHKLSMAIRPRSRTIRRGQRYGRNREVIRRFPPAARVGGEALMLCRQGPRSVCWRLGASVGRRDAREDAVVEVERGLSSLLELHGVRRGRRVWRCWGAVQEQLRHNAQVHGAG